MYSNLLNPKFYIRCLQGIKPEPLIIIYLGSKFEYFWPDEQGTKYFLIYRISTIRKVQINVQNEGDYG